MKVDFHFHLEEGPYSLRWLERTAIALQATGIADSSNGSQEPHSIAWIESLTYALEKRVRHGAFNQDWIRRYLEQGRQRGIERFGLVDHLYRFEECKPYYLKHMLTDDSPLGRLQRKWLDQVCVTSADAYLGAAREAASYDDGLSIGIEADFFPGGEEELKQLLSPLDLDFVIGSVHFIDGWGFDNPDTRRRYETMDLPGLYAGHFANVQQAARSGLFDFIGHPDNLKAFGYRPDEQRLLELYRETARVFAESGVATEINTGLAYRYPVKEMCPSPALLQIFFEAGVPVTLSSDAHYPDDIGSMIDEAVELAKRAGYEETVWFKGRRRYSARL